MVPLTDDERKMVEDNTGLIWWYVNRICKHDTEEERNETYCDGVFGLMRAAQKFRPELGYKFSTYAVIWIKQAVGRGREVRKGGNWRRAKERDEDWFEPASLDAMIGDDINLADMLESDDDVEAEAVVTAVLVEISDRLKGRRFDSIDRADGGVVAELQRERPYRVVADR